MYTRGRGYFGRATRGTGAIQGNCDANNNDPGEGTSHGPSIPKKRKFNPFFRARGEWQSRFQG